MTSHQHSNPAVELVSFDIWQTLITGSAVPGRTRADMLYEMMRPEMPMQAFKVALEDVDLKLDQRSEQTGANYGPEARIAELCDAIGAERMSAEDMTLFYAERAAQFRAFPPKLLDPETPEVLHELGQEHELALVSNTGFINGAEMRVALNAIGILRFFNYQIFSNEVDYCKPHPGIFKALHDQSGVEPRHMLHIGDNPVADVYGAEAAGMQAVLLEKGAKLRDLVGRLIQPEVAERVSS